MNPNKQTIPDDEIDFREVFLRLWKEKYLILIITLVFTIAGYIYHILQPKVYQTTIILRDAPAFKFKKYDTYILISKQQQQQQQQQPISVVSNFRQEFKLNLISLDNLVNFVEENKKLDEFKSYLTTNNIKIRDYFKGKFQLVTEKNNKNKNQYTLNFSSPLPGVEFLNDYIYFTKQASIREFKKKLKESLKIDIEVLEMNLAIAKEINLENPIAKSVDQRGSFVAMYEPEFLFYNGTKVLSKQKFYLEERLKDIDNDNFNYNYILEKAFDRVLLTKSASILMAIAFVLGLFVSFVAIFIRSIFAS